jgi:thymidylate synthase (FAD)
MKKFDYQKVKLISHSISSDYDNVMEPDELVAYCARVSNPANQNNHETAGKLVQYLVKHKHWSPLEMVSATVEIETTRDIARQILRHRSFSFQEFSQRYADPTAALDFTTREARLQDTKNRQNSIATEDEELADEWARMQNKAINAARKAYDWAISNGIAKEQARAVLPEGNTMSRMYMAGTLRSFIHYIDVRTGNGTQAEHMDVANKVAISLYPIFPLVVDFNRQFGVKSQGQTE